MPDSGRPSGQEPIKLVKIDPQRHRALIASWLEAAHVAKWWGDANGRLRQFDATPSSAHALIELEGRPVGYIRWEEVDRAMLESVGLTEVPDGAIDIDILLGDPGATGRGIGPRALDLLATRLERTTTAPVAGLCTSVRNERALKAFAKCGFVRLTRYDDPTYGLCWVLVRRLAGFGVEGVR